jgi:hypothetical protein
MYPNIIVDEVNVGLIRVNEKLNTYYIMTLSLNFAA